ncbi:Rpn family recombination-promoting nuclease/putative transposase [Cohnella rhizosphaerae]|uniref:Rpn family recombination-promoting nuclease/putative transposase n=1 Tax=Cohnella rhizosphaerae TaxID=1457232 RepID=A0A9X4QSA2_9BACL|nr:Rpn family recombination-promoting nuclease/putative transposase [Cohnella rhizosphaerae]MDG0808317.1 Rpn family recombination-promoting nuclease/putative transposase [Cohnella rhizosphaerae]
MAPHDEAFKKLLQTFFKEFIQLFFPELDEWIDYSHTRLLMQELLVDIVGAEARQLDLLIETKLKGQDAYILIHLEPQSYRDPKFVERMYIYFSRLFEKYRADHKLIVPIAVFTGDGMKNEPDTLSMALPWHEIFRFRMLKLELGQQDWRRFIDSDNPVAAALLAKMGYNKKGQTQLEARLFIDAAAHEGQAGQRQAGARPLHSGFVLRAGSYRREVDYARIRQLASRRGGTDYGTDAGVGTMGLRTGNKGRH